MRAQFTIPTLPRHPFLRALVLAAAAVALAGLVTMGLVVGVVAAAFAALMLALRGLFPGRARPDADPSVIEGEFTVVPPRPRQGLPHPE